LLIGAASRTAAGKICRAASILYDGKVLWCSHDETSDVTKCRSDKDNGWNGTDLLNVLHVQARNRYVMKQMYNK
jgi:hypothetical protein